VIRRPLALAIALLLALPALAADAPDVKLALDWLASKQAPDGSFGKTNQLALTGMAGLAFLASGSTPRVGPYKENLRRAIRFTLEQQRGHGQFFHVSNGYSDIHNHGFALTLLAECYGMGDPANATDHELRRAISEGIKATVESQADNGGFSYFLFNDPSSTRFKEMWRDDEASTTVSQLQALRAARNAGFHVPGRAIERALDYIAACQHETGGFIYSLAGGRVSFLEGSKVPSFAITAASICALQQLGRYEGRRLERGIAYMRGFEPPGKPVDFYYYGHYYAAQAMYQYGGAGGDEWTAAILAELAEKQGKDGAFRNGGSTLEPADDAILSTAWAAQIALISRGYLPLFTR
jgi:hypothetical protein